jgi:hypothetical protein
MMKLCSAVYEKKVDGGHKVCCKMFRSKMDVNFLSNAEKVINTVAKENGYVSGEFINSIIYDIDSSDILVDPKALVKNVELSVY